MARIARSIAALAWIFVFVIGCSAPRAAEQRFEFSRLLMGVEARIVLFAGDEQAAVRAADAAFAEIARLEDVFSDWRDDSELAQLAERAGSGPVQVSEDLYDVLRRAREISEATDGAFDVTVGPLVVLWRAARRAGVLPDPLELARARGLVGWRLVALDARTRTVALAKPGMRLDLGGIGKGYAGQRAVDLLADLGHARALVQMGGDVVCGAPPPGRAGWQIDVGGARVLLARRAIATSGDAEQHVVLDGVRYGHVVDPRTGLGAKGARQVTIEAANGAMADALATAGGLLAPEDLGAVLGRLESRLLGAGPRRGSRVGAGRPVPDPNRR